MNPMTTTAGQAVGRVRHGGARGAAERVVGVVAGLLAVMLTLALAPSASASAAYDITQVGDASWAGITSNGKELSEQTVDSNNVPVTAAIRVDIDDMTALQKGDVIDIKSTGASGSHFMPNLYTSSNLPDYLTDSLGRKVFAVRVKDSSTVQIVRTEEQAQGAFSCTYKVTGTLWGDSDATTSEWHIGKSSVYTFSNQSTVSKACLWNSDNPNMGAGVSNAQISLSTFVRNCQTMIDVAKGSDTSGIGTDSLVLWTRAIPEAGTITKTQTWANQIWVQKAYDEDTPGVTYDNRFNQRSVTSADADVSTLDKAKENLEPGTYASQELSDGSWAVAVNFGSRLPGLDNSLQVHDAGDETTLKLLAKTGHIWQNAQFGVFLQFADKTVPNRVRVEMQSTESDLQTTTLTTKPVEPAEGKGQSAIRYDPNGGEGDSFKTVGDPGTEATAAEADIFLREGHTFTGWNTKADGTGTAYEAGATVAYPAEGDTMTLYAQWTPITYTVRFDGNGATSGTMDDLAATYDAEATLPARRYARAGRTFTGWNTKPDGSGASYGDEAAVRNLASVQGEVVVLYAQWADAMTVLPDTGGHAGHAPFAVGMAVTAAALALAVLARRRATRHSI